MDERVDYIFRKEMNDDTSFQEKGNLLELLFDSKKYNKKDMKQTWDSGIKKGINIGLMKASLEGQKIELTNNTQNSKHKAFIEEFYKLAERYKCAIQYHPIIGMVIIDRNH